MFDTEVARVERRVALNERRLAELAKRLDNVLDETRVREIIRTYGIVTLNAQEMAVFKDDISNMVVDKIVEERQGQKTRATDVRWQRWAAIAVVGGTCFTIVITCVDVILHMQ